MRVLIVKLTSMGDLVHTLPALTDAAAQIPGIQFDWVVDEAFAEVPTWHPAVGKVIKTAHRRWKKNVWQTLKSGQLRDFYQQLNTDDYDLIIDMQGSAKSAVVTRLRRGRRHGMDRQSVREGIATFAYQHQHAVSKKQHAVIRLRILLAQALGYVPPQSAPDYQLEQRSFPLPANIELPEKFLFLVHNASWPTKLWSNNHWQTLIKLANDKGYGVVLPSGNQEELERAQQLAANNPRALALPRLSLSQTTGILQQAAGAVCCDTGLTHIAAALATPAVSFYGATDNKLIGALGRYQRHLIANEFECAPCYKRMCHYQKPASTEAACMTAFSPEAVWESLQQLMQQKENDQADLIASDRGN